MNIYPKLLTATLPVVFVFIVTAMGTTYYFAYQALTTLADRWIETRLVEAMAATSEQEAILHTYGLAEIPASIAKAQMDAGASMAAIEVGAEGYIFAVDIRGVLAAHPETTTVGGYVSKAEWFRQLKREGGRFRYQVAGQNHLAMYDYFAPWGWYVIVTAPEREVYGAIDRMRPYIVYLGLAGTAVLAYILMLLTRRLTEPLRLLTEGARHIGQGDLTTRIPVQSGDEFGQLANVFNRMTTNLKETLGTLQKKEENFRALIENSSDIVTILDGRGALLYHSPSA
jgi:methyl-accepting chemotaxis protein